MYKIVLVDDDALMRTKMKMMIEEAGDEFVLCGEASDGVEALDRIERERPDIVLSDIRMPRLDGVALSAALRERHPETLLIVLSNYDDFEYARSTFRNGAGDYILKHTLTPSVLTETLRAAAARLSTQRPAMNGREATNDSSKLDSRAARRRFVELLTTGAFVSDQELVDAGATFGIPVDPSGAVLVLMEIDDFYKLAAALDGPTLVMVERSILTLGQEIIDQQSKGTIIPIAPERYLLLLSPPRRLIDRGDDEYYRHHVRTLLERIRGCIKNVVDTGVSFGYGSLVRAAAEIPRSFREAEEALKGKFLLGKDALSEAAEIADATGWVSLDVESEQDLVAAVESCDAKRVERRISTLFRTLRRGGLDRSRSQMLFNDLHSVLHRLCLAHTIELNDLFEDDRPPHDALDTLETLDEIHDRFSSLFAKLLSLVDDAEFGSYSPHVRDAVLIVRRRFAEQLKEYDIADELGIHSSYLSKLFKREVGVGFSEYLNRTRIARAKELFRLGENNIKEVSYRCGFHSYTYFFNCFKRLTGCTPREFMTRPRRDDRA